MVVVGVVGVSVCTVWVCQGVDEGGRRRSQHTHTHAPNQLPNYTPCRLTWHHILHTSASVLSVL